ncbi:MAG: ribonuclease III [Acidobacteria bacterium]|nr:ribonuclease III [Acidobacteriota bacterium]
MKQHEIEEIEKKLNYHFQNQELLKQAFTHRSCANTHKKIPHNERLEFLGDSVLGFVVAEDLYRRFPDKSEGILSKIKAYMVHSDVLARITETLALHKFLLLEEGDQKIRNNRKLKENLLEAVIGAVYLDGGIAAAGELILSLFDRTGYRITDPKDAVFDYKTKLQEMFQSMGMQPPDYVLLERRGPVHNAVFVTEIRVNGVPLARGEGRSKKEAHQNCAAKVLARTDSGTPLSKLLHEADSRFSS